MRDNPPDPEFKSAERLAFETYLRTGKRPDPTERKFNPYHDPRNGRFTFAPGEPRSGVSASGSDPRGPWRPKRKLAKPLNGPTADDDSVPKVNKILQGALPTETVQTAFRLAGGSSRGPRRRGRSGGGSPPGDPKLLDDMFPRLSRSPMGSIVRMVDGALDLTTAANEATREIHNARVRRLVAEIRDVDPDYRFESLGEPETIEGRARQIKALRFRRAIAFYRMRNDLRPMQVEVLRIMQERADLAYEEAVRQYDKGRLTPRLSREEAIGNYVDAAVRADLRSVFNLNQIDTSDGQPVRVVGREYDTSGTDRTYRIPDARVANIAFDVTLTRKTLATAQVRGFFNADFRPDVVVIIRPSQLGGSNTYAITKPGK